MSENKRPIGTWDPIDVSEKTTKNKYPLTTKNKSPLRLNEKRDKLNLPQISTATPKFLTPQSAQENTFSFKLNKVMKAQNDEIFKLTDKLDKVKHGLEQGTNIMKPEVDFRKIRRNSVLNDNLPVTQTNKESSPKDKSFLPNLDYKTNTTDTISVNYAD